MKEVKWRLNLLLLAMATMTSTRASPTLSGDVCNQYGHDTCSCLSDPRCFSLRQKAYCGAVSEACELLRLSGTDCRRNGELYAGNGVICEYHGNDGGICASKQISFGLERPSTFDEIVPTMDEFGVVPHAENDLLVRTRGDIFLNYEQPCLVYQILVKQPGKFQMILEKTTDTFPGMTLNVMVNGAVVVHELNGARYKIGQKIRINYGIQFNEKGQSFVLINGEPVPPFEEGLIQVRICQGICSMELVQSVDDPDPFFLKLDEVVQFKRSHHSSNENLVRPKRDLLDNLKLNVGLDIIDNDKNKGNGNSTTTTKKPKKAKSDEEEEEGEGEESEEKPKKKKSKKSSDEDE